MLKTDIVWDGTLCLVAKIFWYFMWWYTVSYGGYFLIFYVMVHSVLWRIFSDISCDGILCLIASIFWISEGFITSETSGTTHLTADRYIPKTSIFILSPVLFYSRGAQKGGGVGVAAQQPTPKQTMEFRPCDLNWVGHYVYMYVNSVAINVILGRHLCSWCAVHYIDAETQIWYNLRVCLPVKILGFEPLLFPRYLHYPLVAFLLSGRRLF